MRKIIIGLTFLLALAGCDEKVTTGKIDYGVPECGTEGVPELPCVLYADPNMNVDTTTIYYRISDGCPIAATDVACVAAAEYNRPSRW